MSTFVNNNLLSCDVTDWTNNLTFSSLSCGSCETCICVRRLLIVLYRYD